MIKLMNEETQSWSNDSCIRTVEAKSGLPFLQGDQHLGDQWQNDPGKLPLWKTVLWSANKKATLWHHIFYI